MRRPLRVKPDCGFPGAIDVSRVLFTSIVETLSEKAGAPEKTFTLVVTFQGGHNTQFVFETAKEAVRWVAKIERGK